MTVQQFAVELSKHKQGGLSSWHAHGDSQAALAMRLMQDDIACNANIIYNMHTCTHRQHDE